MPGTCYGKCAVLNVRGEQIARVVARSSVPAQTADTFGCVYFEKPEPYPFKKARLPYVVAVDAAFAFGVYHVDEPGLFVHTFTGDKATYDADKMVDTLNRLWLLARE
jgi:hypothetical protein